MSNQPQPAKIAPEEYKTFSVMDLLRTLIFFTPLILLLIVVVLALLGPSVGNIFSNVVSTL